MMQVRDLACLHHLLRLRPGEFGQRPDAGNLPLRVVGGGGAVAYTTGNALQDRGNAEQEQAEIAVIEGYLPKQLSADEVAEVAAKVKQELGATGLKDMGRCMGVLKDRYAGRVDMGRASQTMKQLLT